MTRAHDDPFERTTFDDDFVRGAAVHEESADDRVQRWRHVDAEHRRIVEEARAHVREQAARHGQATTPSRRRPDAGRWAVVVVGILVVAFFWVRSREGDHAAPTTRPDVADLQGDQPLRSAVRLEGGQPPPGVDAQASPLGRPAPLPPAAGPHAFVASQPDGTAPVAYDPCRPIRVVVNARTLPARADQLLDDALARVGAATGLQFVTGGASAEVPAEDRPPYQPDRYGERWAPILVAWSDPTETPALSGDTAGQAGSTWFELERGSVFVTGSVVLDGPQLDELLTGPGGRSVALGIVLHELGHLVGLDHVGDPSQLMYPETTEELTDFAPGDLHGLAALGTGRCFPEV